MERHTIDVLLEKMTLDEKVGQLMQYAGAFYSEEANDTPVTGPAELPINQHAVKKKWLCFRRSRSKKNDRNSKRTFEVESIRDSTSFYGRCY